MKQSGAHVGPEVDLLAEVVNLLDLLLGQLGKLDRLPELFDPLVVPARRDSDDALCAAPKQEHGSVVDVLAGLLRKTSGDAGEDGGEGTALGGVAEKGGEGSVGLDDDVLALADLEDGREVGEDERVKLEL